MLIYTKLSQANYSGINLVSFVMNTNPYDCIFKGIPLHRKYGPTDVCFLTILIILNRSLYIIRLTIFPCASTTNKNLLHSDPKIEYPLCALLNVCVIPGQDISASFNKISDGLFVRSILNYKLCGIGLYGRTKINTYIKYVMCCSCQYRLAFKYNEIQKPSIRARLRGRSTFWAAY